MTLGVVEEKHWNKTEEQTFTTGHTPLCSRRFERDDNRPCNTFIYDVLIILKRMFPRYCMKFVITIPRL